MATEIGTISLTGLLTCNLCDWSRWVDPEATPVSQLTMHRMAVHFDEYERQHPESAAIIREADAATELTRHDQAHGMYEEGK